jgi:hypothetical protein
MVLHALLDARLKVGWIEVDPEHGATGHEEECVRGLRIALCSTLLPCVGLKE